MRKDINNVEIIFLCGVFPNEDKAYYSNNKKIVFENSANKFQNKILYGLRCVSKNLSVISAPFIGAYPNLSKLVRFKKIKRSNVPNLTYVSFLNIWGLRNISRKKTLKKALVDHIKKCDKSEILIIGYSAHEPIIEAAVYAKTIDSRIKICLIVPDLPQYMNLSSNRSNIYDFMKNIDSKKIDKYLKSVDTFMILSKYMKEPLSIDNRPYIVIEGIAENLVDPNHNFKRNEIKNIVYTGKLLEQYGLKNLVDAFIKTDNKDLRLILCGDGDCEQYILDAAATDSRIVFMGKVSAEKAVEVQKEAFILINPRENRGEYVKYSFPSKLIEYLQTGNPVVSYYLSGMPDCYSDFLYLIEDSDNPANSIIDAIDVVLTDSDYIINQKYKRFAEYSNNHLYYKTVAASLLKLNDIL